MPCLVKALLLYRRIQNQMIEFTRLALKGQLPTRALLHGANLEVSVQGEKKERWMLLCEQAAIEQDPQKLSELVQEIDRLLGEKQTRLDNLRKSPE